MNRTEHTRDVTKNRTATAALATSSVGVHGYTSSHFQTRPIVPHGVQNHSVHSLGVCFRSFSPFFLTKFLELWRKVPKIWLISSENGSFFCRPGLHGEGVVLNPHQCRPPSRGKWEKLRNRTRHGCQSLAKIPLTSESSDINDKRCTTTMVVDADGKRRGRRIAQCCRPHRRPWAYRDQNFGRGWHKGVRGTLTYCTEKCLGPLLALFCSVQSSL